MNQSVLIIKCRERAVLHESVKGMMTAEMIMTIHSNLFLLRNEDYYRGERMENSYRYFKNEKCKYFPCHKVEKETDFNCLFCYCPLNQYEDCPGNPHFIVRESGKKIKDCTYCTFPHQPENYEKVVRFLSEKMK